jgi:hypothetical protein
MRVSPSEFFTDDYIAKPMSVMNFINTVERFLR